MKSKVFIAAALIGLVAAGCSSSTKQPSQQNMPAQNTPATGNQASPTPVATPPTPEPAPGVVDNPDQPMVFNIDITGNGFSPASITIHKGDYVQFTNKDVDAHWPASDPHPIHNGYPGFDAGHGLAQGEVYRHQFNLPKTGTFGFHDHLNPSMTGKIIILP